MKNRLDKYSYLISQKYYLLFTLFFLYLIFILYITSYFKLGFLSDSYQDSYYASNTSLIEKFDDTIYKSRLRPLLFITLQYLEIIKKCLNLSYDNFIITNLFNLFLYILMGIFFAKIIYEITSRYYFSFLSLIFLLIYPNNIHNLCWSASFFEIILAIFYILSLYSNIKYVKRKEKRYIIYSLLFVILGLLTKETFISMPFVTIFIVYIYFGKNIIKECKLLFISQLFILIAYITYRFIVISFNSYYTSESSLIIFKSLEIYFKGFVSILIPWDYIELTNDIYSLNLQLYLYLILLLSLMFLYLYYNKMTLKNVLILLLIFFFSVIPNLIAGYIRPQLILIPFILVFISLIGFSKDKTYCNRRIHTVKYIFVILLLIVWNFRSIDNINNWNKANNIFKEKTQILIDYENKFDDKSVILGNIKRVQQYFIFENLIFPYNYYKYKDFVLLDTLKNYLPVVLYSFNDINYKTNFSVIDENTYKMEIDESVGYFDFIDEMNSNNDIYSIDDYLDVQILSKNRFNKPFSILITLLKNDSRLFIFDGLGIINLKEL